MSFNLLKKLSGVVLDTAESTDELLHKGYHVVKSAAGKIETWVKDTATTITDAGARTYNNIVVTLEKSDNGVIKALGGGLDSAGEYIGQFCGNFMTKEEQILGILSKFGYNILNTADDKYHDFIDMLKDYVGDNVTIDADGNPYIPLDDIGNVLDKTKAYINAAGSTIPGNATIAGQDVQFIDLEAGTHNIDISFRKDGSGMHSFMTRTIFNAPDAFKIGITANKQTGPYGTYQMYYYFCVYGKYYNNITDKSFTYKNIFGDNTLSYQTAHDSSGGDYDYDKLVALLGTVINSSTRYFAYNNGEYALYQPLASVEHPSGSTGADPETFTTRIYIDGKNVPIDITVVTNSTLLSITNSDEDLKASITNVSNSHSSNTPVIDATGGDNITSIPDSVINNLKNNTPDEATDDFLNKKGIKRMRDRSSVNVPSADPDGNPTTLDRDGETPTYHTTIPTDGPKGNEIISPTVPEPNDSGSTPDGIIPETKLTGLVTYYNVSESALSSLSNILWPAQVNEEIKNYFFNPLASIVSLFEIYAPIVTTTGATIHCGPYDTSISAPVITKRYTTFTTKEIQIPEYYNNAMDYEPYTDISLYIPFIGVVSLHANEVIGKAISLKFLFDTYTGLFTVSVRVHGNGITNALYFFSGNCSCSLPVTAANMTSMITGALGLISGNTFSSVPKEDNINTGGIYDKALTGVNYAATALRNDVSQSGSMSGVFGACLSKIPYIKIIRRRAKISIYNPYGYNDNSYVQLKKCKHFVRCKEVNVLGIKTASDNEKREIENFLKEGVFIE